MDFNVVASAESSGGDDAPNSADAVRYVQVMQERGMAEARAGDHHALNTLDELAAMVARSDLPWFWAIAVEAKARALAILGDLDGAIECCGSRNCHRNTHDERA